MPGFNLTCPGPRSSMRIGDEAIATEDDAKLSTYFPDNYVFHGPGGDLSYEGLGGTFESLRTAFSGLRIVREQIIVDGNFLTGTVPRSPSSSPRFLRSRRSAPSVPPGRHVVWENDRYVQVQQRRPTRPRSGCRELAACNQAGHRSHGVRLASH